MRFSKLPSGLQDCIIAISLIIFFILLVSVVSWHDKKNYVKSNKYEINIVCVQSHRQKILCPHYNPSNLNDVTYTFEMYEVCDQYRMDTIVIK